MDHSRTRRQSRGIQERKTVDRTRKAPLVEPFEFAGGSVPERHQMIAGGRRDDSTVGTPSDGNRLAPTRVSDLPDGGEPVFEGVEEFFGGLSAVQLP